ncbi:hypothetical protein [Streptomyces glomeratus]|uniref:hypothetical protein n=1 Tax=Streptomyces glomeratus TaxID=284452 RepID=UPI001F2FC893|nr:hypothetical protein [Streptomyces glomeratus]MCF1512156.1 hypothetical protein [Streptomyces glomeratus]
MMMLAIIWFSALAVGCGLGKLGVLVGVEAEDLAHGAGCVHHLLFGDALLKLSGTAGLTSAGSSTSWRPTARSDGSSGACTS